MTRIVILMCGCGRQLAQQLESDRAPVILSRCYWRRDWGGGTPHFAHYQAAQQVEVDQRGNLAGDIRIFACSRDCVVWLDAQNRVAFGGVSRV